MKVCQRLNVKFNGSGDAEKRERYTLRERIQINGRRITQIEKMSAPGLPKFIILDSGTYYRLTTFFLGYHNRAGWVPIHPITDQWYIKPIKVGGDCEEHTQTMLPLRLCWSWTIWKAQGQTI